MSEIKLTKTFRVDIPIAVARAAAKGLILRADYRRGGTAVGIATAKKLVRNGELPLSFVLHIADYFPRHAGDMLDQKNPPSNGWIAWLLWGGNAGRKWATSWKREWERQLARDAREKEKAKAKKKGTGKKK